MLYFIQKMLICYATLSVTVYVTLEYNSPGCCARLIPSEDNTYPHGCDFTPLRKQNVNFVTALFSTPKRN